MVLEFKDGYLILPMFGEYVSKGYWKHITFPNGRKECFYFPNSTPTKHWSDYEIQCQKYFYIINQRKPTSFNHIYRYLKANDNNQFFEEILLELSYRSDEGYPDFSKPQHITILSEILTEWGLTDVKYELIKNLLKEEEEKPLDDKEKEKAKQLGLVWKGKGYGKEER